MRFLVLAVLCIAECIQAETLVPLSFELPGQRVVTGLTSFWGRNLEPRSNKSRPPFLAPEGTTVISRGVAVTASAAPTRGKLAQITDGIKDYGPENAVALPSGTQYVQLDLGAEKTLYAALLWHTLDRVNIYFCVVFEISNDPTFTTGVTTVYNNDDLNEAGLGAGKDKTYFESAEGRLIDFKGARARYIRCYSRGNAFRDTNDYVELEVWGK